MSLIRIALISVTLMVSGCGGYEAPQSGSDDGLSTLECEGDCIPKVAANLQLKPSLGGSGSEYSVPADLFEWNLGGECNEGGFKFNTIRWELHQGGQLRRHSGMGWPIPGSTQLRAVDAQCVNGRFLLFINLKPISEDNVDRTGLRVPTGGRAAYELYIEIYGKDAEIDNTPTRNSSRGRFKVSLLAI